MYLFWCSKYAHCCFHYCCSRNFPFCNLIGVGSILATDLPAIDRVVYEGIGARVRVLREAAVGPLLVHGRGVGLVGPSVVARDGGGEDGQNHSHPHSGFSEGFFRNSCRDLNTSAKGAAT